jgi:hypothetical protein
VRYEWQMRCMHNAPSAHIAKVKTGPKKLLRAPWPAINLSHAQPLALLYFNFDFFKLDRPSQGGGGASSTDEQSATHMHPTSNSEPLRNTWLLYGKETFCDISRTSGSQTIDLKGKLPFASRGLTKDMCAFQRDRALVRPQGEVIWI